MEAKQIDLSKTALGIEFGSTRIKAVLIDEDHSPVASGEYAWENQFVAGYWTYELSEVWKGLQAAYSDLQAEVKAKYKLDLHTVGSIGISAMMHGYLPFNEHGEQLAAFRTWRNTTTEEAATRLSEAFQFNIPLRWSIAHLYQAILNDEEHVSEINFLTTLAGYVHWQLTGEKVLGVGEASGMFPIDPQSCTYDAEKLDLFTKMVAGKSYKWTIHEILPNVRSAGEEAGTLTEDGAKLLDPTGVLKPGIPFCPPEGDAGTGMVATNSIKKHTGNVSAGTSIFAMIVLEEHLSTYYEEIDIVTTPTGTPVAMVHCNNFTSDLNDWVGLFQELIALTGGTLTEGELFPLLFERALEADSDVGGLTHCNYLSGEHLTKFEEGRPLFVRMPTGRLNLANFICSQIFASLATLQIGLNLLIEKEQVQVDRLYGHGGFFKTEKVGQQLMADALNTPVSVMGTAGEGGPWGMAILAQYMRSQSKDPQSLEAYLESKVFKDVEGTPLTPTSSGKERFSRYMKRYHHILEVERLAVDLFKS